MGVTRLAAELAVLKHSAAMPSSFAGVELVPLPEGTRERIVEDARRLIKLVKAVADLDPYRGRIDVAGFESGGLCIACGSDLSNRETRLDAASHAKACAWSECRQQFPAAAYGAWIREVVEAAGKCPHGVPVGEVKEVFACDWCRD